jgi:undecaprenyl-diphosphatase
MNYQVFQLLNGWAGHIDPIDDVMVGAARWLIYAVFAAGVALVGRALYRRRWTAVAAVASSLLLAFLGAALLEQMTTEVRPFQTHQVHQLIPHAAGASLPSDHATAAFAVGFATLAFLHRRWGWMLIGAAALIGVARVWVGVHYPGDILAAAVIAGLATLEVKTAVLWLPHPLRSSSRQSPGPNAGQPLRDAR